MFNGNCEINVSNRHVCSYCRLAKCFQSGMQSELIRSSRSRPNKRYIRGKNLKNSPEAKSLALIKLNEMKQVG